jgi:hypothetical protein
VHLEESLPFTQKICVCRFYIRHTQRSVSLIFRIFKRFSREIFLI